MTKRTYLVGLGLTAALALLGACGNLEKGINNVDPAQQNTNNQSITTGRIDNGVYQAVMKDGKYQVSKSRDLNASRMNSGYNQDNFENGLLRLSHDEFSVDKYYFQEGQYLDEETIRKWLSRSSDDDQGLNPGKGPIIFQQLMEQDFLDENGKIAGISLGFAFNSVYYDNDGKATDISRDDLMANARQTVNSVLTRVRQLDGLGKVPIVIGLFEQASKDNIVGGTYIYKAVSKDGKTTIDKFDSVKEEYASLPVINNQTNAATDDGLAGKFDTFKDSIQGFFPNLSGVTGIAYYQEGVLQNVSIVIETKYYSKTEITSFTQFVGKQVESVFNIGEPDIEVQINSIEGPQAFVAKRSGEEAVYSHIFQ
ncbi:CamS family sex pheromone protein [Enterococcus canis]|nr:CamS family sex pheromone protein [Enterococcus canis]